MFNPSNWQVDEIDIKDVELSDSKNSYSVTTTDSTGFSVSNNVDTRSFVMHPGKATIFSDRGFGLGSMHHGLIQDGWVISYTTREQAKANSDLWKLHYDKRKEEEYKRNLTPWIARGEALSEPYRKRLARFTEEKGLEWWREDGGYELFILEQSDAMVSHFSQYADPVGMLMSFKDADYKDQQKEFPGLSDGHSGNTFYGSVGLAKHVLEGRDI